MAHITHSGDWSGGKETREEERWGLLHSMHLCSYVILSDPLVITRRTELYIAYGR
jgi:hypothetical protein